MSAGDSRRAPFRTDKSGIAFDSDDGTRQANPSKAINIFERTNGDGDRFTDTLPPLPIPGHGTRDPECGDDVPRFCADCGHVSHVGSTCYSWECPRCWKGADRRRAKAVVSKLEALRRAKESKRPGWNGWKFHHLVLSPPDGFAVDSDTPLDRTVTLLKEVLGELGVDTGAWFYHPWRGEDGDDRGFWKHLLPDGEAQDWSDTREELSYSPHFHVVALSKNVDGGHVTRAIEKATGWLIERITKGEESNVSIYNEFDLARVVTYCLSHTGVDDGSNQYGYFGQVHNFVPEPHIEREADAAVRSVGVNTLGLPYDSVACTLERDKLVTETVEVPAEKVNLGAGNGDGAVPPEEDTVEIEEEKEVRENCDGRLLDIKNAPAFLTDDDWMADADHAEELQSTWAEWRERVDDDPEEFPPD
jgi:hypothetical protein